VELHLLEEVTARIQNPNLSVNRKLTSDFFSSGEMWGNTATFICSFNVCEGRMDVSVFSVSSVDQVMRSAVFTQVYILFPISVVWREAVTSVHGPKEDLKSS
jgi:uncharacterized membrane protein